MPDTQLQIHRAGAGPGLDVLIFRDQGACQSYIHTFSRLGHLVRRWSAKELYFAILKCLLSIESSKSLPTSSVFLTSMCQDTTQVTTPTTSVFRIISTPSTDTDLYCLLRSYDTKMPAVLKLMKWGSPFCLSQVFVFRNAQFNSRRRTFALQKFPVCVI